MCAKWNKNSKLFDQDLVLSRIAKTASVQEDGRVAFGGWEYDEHLAILESMVTLSDIIPSEFQQSLLFSSIAESIKQNKIDKDSVINEITNQERKYLKKPIENFTILTSLSISQNSSLPNIKIKDCFLKFSQKYPKKYLKYREDNVSRAQKLLRVNEYENFIKVQTIAKGRSDYEAVSKGLTAINYFRGILNLYFNKDFVIQFGSSPRSTINEVILGAYHTAHKSNGKTSSDTFWYETDIVNQKKPISINEKIQDLYLFINKIGKRLNNIKYNDKIEESILRYSTALDSPSEETNFIKLWNILEFLTNTIGGSYETAIKRTAFLYADHAYHKQVLEHLRINRNSTIHGSNNNIHKTYIYQLQRYVQRLILFHINMGHNFSNFSEVGSFLDLPVSKTELTNRKKVIELGLKFTSPKT